MPSMVTFGNCPPTNFTRVGNRSNVAATYHSKERREELSLWSDELIMKTGIMLYTSCVLPLLIFPGHLAMAGTLCPPSHVVAFPHLRGPAFPPRISWPKAGLEDNDNRIIITLHTEFLHVFIALNVSGWNGIYESNHHFSSIDIPFPSIVLEKLPSYKSSSNVLYSHAYNYLQ